MLPAITLRQPVDFRVHSTHIEPRADLPREAKLQVIPVVRRRDGIGTGDEPADPVVGGVMREERLESIRIPNRKQRGPIWLGGDAGPEDAGVELDRPMRSDHQKIAVLRLPRFHVLKHASERGVRRAHRPAIDLVTLHPLRKDAVLRQARRDRLVKLAREEAGDAGAVWI
jgi:hypothetical protein